MTQGPVWGWNYAEHPFDAWDADAFVHALQNTACDVAKIETLRAVSPRPGDLPLRIVSGGSPAQPESPSLARSLSRGGR